MDSATPPPWRTIFAVLDVTLRRGLISVTLVLATQMVAPTARSADGPAMSKRQLDVSRDYSPLPNYKGDFVSIGAGGRWHLPRSVGVFAIAGMTGGRKPPPTDCSREAIIRSAELAPELFEKEKNGLLYGVRTHTAATRVKNMPGYNSCALVVYAILKKAGCGWVRRTANAKALYDMAWRRGWRPSETQNGGCLVAWNSRWEGKRARIGRGRHVDPSKKGGVYNRHLGVTTGSWMSVDNTSIFSAPSAFIVNRPIRYEAPLYLCPPKK